MSTQLILASASPRRQELLDQIGVSYEVMPVAIDEAPKPNEAPIAYVKRLACAKAMAAHAQATMERPVLGADTAVVVDGRILGKPKDRGEACAMLRCLSGRAHRVLSAVTLVHFGRTLQALSESRVHFRPLSETEISAYWDTGEPRDKAGAYAIQGRGAVFVKRLEGSFSGVVGLPLYETAQLLRQIGIEVP